MQLVDDGLDPIAHSRIWRMTREKVYIDRRQHRFRKDRNQGDRTPRCPQGGAGLPRQTITTPRRHTHRWLPVQSRPRTTAGQRA